MKHMKDMPTQQFLLRLPKTLPLCPSNKDVYIYYSAKNKGQCPIIQGSKLLTDLFSIKPKISNSHFITVPFKLIPRTLNSPRIKLLSKDFSNILYDKNNKKGGFKVTQEFRVKILLKIKSIDNPRSYLFLFNIPFKFLSKS